MGTRAALLGGPALSYLERDLPTRALPPLPPPPPPFLVTCSDERAAARPALALLRRRWGGEGCLEADRRGPGGGAPRCVESGRGRPGR